MELVRRADAAALIQCPVDSFAYLGGLPERNTLGPYCGRTVRLPGTASSAGRTPLRSVLEMGGKDRSGGQRKGTVEVWAGDERIAVHPRA